MSKNTNIKRLLINMHCSRCGADFGDDAIKIMRSENGLLVFQVKCEHCKKCFGMALLGISEKELGQSLDFGLENFDPDKKPIDYDDVLNAHDFFQNLDENWSKYIKKD